jgi:hypothetical protein
MGLQHDEQTAVTEPSNERRPPERSDHDDRGEGPDPIRSAGLDVFLRPDDAEVDRAHSPGAEE